MRSYAKVPRTAIADLPFGDAVQTGRHVRPRPAFAGPGRWRLPGWL